MYRQRRSISDVLPVKIAIQHFVRHVYLSKSWATKYINVWNTIAEITRAYKQPYHHQSKRVEYHFYILAKRQEIEEIVDSGPGPKKFLKTKKQF